MTNYDSELFYTRLNKLIDALKTLGLWVLIVFAFATWTTTKDAYALFYKVDKENIIFKNNSSAECDFFSSPIGVKACRYVPVPQILEMPETKERSLCVWYFKGERDPTAFPFEAAVGSAIEAPFLCRTGENESEYASFDLKFTVEVFFALVKALFETIDETIRSAFQRLHTEIAAWRADTTYEGQYEAGRYNGAGTLSFPDGSKYVGDFRDGKRNGIGTWSYPDGTKMRGFWKDGRMDGVGGITCPDGTWYIGVWKDGDVVRVAKGDSDGRMICPSLVFSAEPSAEKDFTNVILIALGASTLILSTYILMIVRLTETLQVQSDEPWREKELL